MRAEVEWECSERIPVEWAGLRSPPANPPHWHVESQGTSPKHVANPTEPGAVLTSLVAPALQLEAPLFDVSPPPRGVWGGSSVC